MYAHTQDRIDEIIARNLENTAPAVPALIGYRVFSQGDHEHIVEFAYQEIHIGVMKIDMSFRTYNGRTWT